MDIMKKRLIFFVLVAMVTTALFSACENECVCRHNYQGQEWYENLGEMPWYDCGDYEYNMRNEVPANHSIKCSGTKYKGKM